MNGQVRRSFAILLLVGVLVLNLSRLTEASDGSGTNSVSPTAVNAGSAGNTLTFTFTAAETMNSGEIAVTIPNGWSAPQASTGIAGYTVAASSLGIIGTVLDNVDSITGWSAGTACLGGLTQDMSVKQEGSGSISCANGNEGSEDRWYKNITTPNWSGYTKIAFWIRSGNNIGNATLNFAYADTANLASPLEEINIGAVSANTWTYVVLSFGVTTRTSVASFGFIVKSASSLDNQTILVDDILVGPGLPTFPGGDIISTRLLQLSSGQTVTVTYGSGGGASGVTAPVSGETSTFTTKTRISDAGTLTSIASSPTVTVNNPAPTTSSISPISKTVGDVTFTMTVNGTNFVPASVVRFNGSNRTTAYVSSTQLTASISSDDLTTAGTFNITVFNPTPGGGTSGAQTFIINTLPPSLPPPPPSSPPASSGSSGGVSPTSVNISGQAYPESKIEFLRKSVQDEMYRNTPDVTSAVFADGTFRIQLTGLLGGEYLFALRAEDKDGRKTGVIAFNMDLLRNDRFVAENIFIPPTLDFENAIVPLGKEIKMRGYAAPGRRIEIEIDGLSKAEIKSEINGYWAFATSTASFRTGDHYVRARQIDGDGSSSSLASLGTSEFSISRTFRVSLPVSSREDFNADGKINIIDWSIFLFRWGSEGQDLKAKIDLNDDGKIDISDFSIFLKIMQI